VGKEIEMDEFKLNHSTLNNGVYIITEINNEFESVYLKVRDNEKRIYSDEELKKLPFASDINPHKQEWIKRSKSYHRFNKYLKAKRENLNILDLGCGNGWFCGQLANSFNHSFYCADVNLAELKQGRKAFDSEQLKFIYADIFTAEIPESLFDMIIINAAVQYFPDLKKLTKKLLSLINEDGEIHIIDSPFYSENEVNNARERTRAYYSSLNFPEMEERYFHHTYKELSEFNTNTLYNPASLRQKIKRLILSNDSPFPWIVIRK
jgi:ubiquinone/menaquinone biosynthesis C-methylase UbiE